MTTPPPFRRRRPGQVLVVTVLAIVLLTGLIFYVMNIGDHANRRVAAQNAADAAAISAATQLARSMNAVSANNIAISRMLSAVITLDGFERHLEASHGQAEAFHEGMEDQVDNTGPAGYLQQATAEALVTIRDRLELERDILAEHLPIVQSLNIWDETTYTIPGRAGEPPHGGFWATARDLDLFSEGTIEATPTAVAVNAARYARVSRAGEGLAAPIAATVPATRGEWETWYDDPENRADLLTAGWIPDHGFPPKNGITEDYTFNEAESLKVRPGPFWAFFRWRWALTELNMPGSGEYVMPNRGGFGTHPGNSISSTPTGDYRTHGPVAWMHNVIYNEWHDDLHYSIPHYRYGSGLRTILWGLQRAILTYMFSSSADQMLHDPEWETDYITAGTREGTGGNVELTAHFRMEIIGPYGPDDAGIAQIARDERYSNWHDPLLLIEPGWRDRSTENASASLYTTVRIRPTRFAEDTPEGYDIPDEFSLAVRLYAWDAWLKLANHFWQAEFEPEDFERYLDQMVEHGQLWYWIRLHLDLPEDYPPFEFDYEIEAELPYITYRDIFAGADFGTDTYVHNPANFPASHYPDELPAPYLLDWHGRGYSDDHDEGIRREYLSLLGIARSSAQADIWPTRFASASPAGSMLALAQAEVFNPTSFDLWTQNWQAQLVPVTQVGQWADRLADQQHLYEDIRSIVSAEGMPEAEDIDIIIRYLRAIGAREDDLEQVILH